MKPFGKVEELKKFGKIMVIALGFGLLAVALSSIPSRPAAALGSAPVTVVNTPLPVTGTVGVNNFPAVQNVSFNGTAQPVSFSNTSATPLFVDVENRARKAFDVTGNCSFSGGNLCSPSSDAFSVPAGKIAVIESVSGICAMDSGNLAQIVVSFKGSSGFMDFYLVPGPPVIVGVNTVTSFAQDLRAYAFGDSTASTPIDFSTLASGANSGTCNFTISGYLVTP